MQSANFMYNLYKFYLKSTTLKWNTKTGYVIYNSLWTRNKSWIRWVFDMYGSPPVCDCYFKEKWLFTQKWPKNQKIELKWPCVYYLKLRQKFKSWAQVRNKHSAGYHVFKPWLSCSFSLLDQTIFCIGEFLVNIDNTSI